MNSVNIWDKYENIKKMSSSLYKGKNKEKGNYVVIKEIDKIQFNKDYKISEKEFLDLINKEKLISIIEIINSRDYYYIVMELCLTNLEEYMKIRDKGLTIEELRDFLIELNKILKTKEMIYRDLNLSNILISLNEINKISIKISDLGLNKKINEELTMTSTKISYSRSPEIIENYNIHTKSDLWNLGIIIYYLLFKEYPYKGENKKESNIEFQLKKITNKDLKDLLNKMIYLNEEISWEEYFNHSFFIPKIEHNSFFIPKIGYLSDEHKLEFDFSSHKYQLLENYDNYDMFFIITLLGDNYVGKSYLYLNSKSDKLISMMSSIGIEEFYFGIKIDDKIIKLEIRDTAGQERYRSIPSKYYRVCTLAIFVYSVNNRKSFENTNVWLCQGM